MVWFYMLTIPVDLFLTEANEKSSLLNPTRKMSGERCREGFSMNSAQYMSKDKPAPEQLVWNPHSGRVPCSDLPGHLSKISSEDYGRRLRGLPVYNSPFSRPSWFLMWWHSLLGKGHQNQACSMLEEGARAEANTGTWKLEGQLVVATGRKWEGVMLCSGFLTAQLLDTIYEFPKPLHNPAHSLTHRQATGRVLYSWVLTRQFLQITAQALPIRVFLNGVALLS